MSCAIRHLMRGNITFHASSINKNLLRASTTSKYIVPGRRKTDVGPKTLELQDKLGNLPVPNINDTIAKFLISSKQLLNNDEFATTAKKILELAQPNGIGEKLQEVLVKRKSEHDNWLYGWWLELAYLGYRDSVCVWSSPGFVWPHQTFNNTEEQLDFASKIIRGALDYKNLLDEQKIPVEMSGKMPMDMITYYRLFGMNRQPHEGVDVQTFSSDSKHIIVAHNKNFFRFDVADREGKLLNVSQIHEALTSVVKESIHLGAGNSVGGLTSDNRDNWAQAYKILTKDNRNKDSVGEIESSLFLMCLDEDMSQVSAYDESSRSALQSLHGLESTENRWNDKALQFYVGISGENGLLCEHSPSDGLVAMKIGDHAIDCVKGKLKIDETPAGFVMPPKHLKFVLPAEIDPYIGKAKDHMKALQEDLQMKVLSFNSFGKGKIKTFKLSPDSFVQMAIQLAFYRLHGIPVATYESGGTRVYKEGRTETIRSCSQESFDFTTKMMNTNVSDDEKYNALITAIKGHNFYAKMATSGYGVDRHLTGLKKAAVDSNIPVPDFFQDPGYLKTIKMRLSTSQISGRNGGFTCYGPLQPDGYGTCYSIENDFIKIACSALKSCSETSVENMTQALENSLNDIHDLCEKQKASKL